MARHQQAAAENCQVPTEWQEKETVVEGKGVVGLSSRPKRL